MCKKLNTKDSFTMKPRNTKGTHRPYDMNYNKNALQ